MIIPIHGMHGIRESQVDHSRSGEDTELRGSQPSAVLRLGTVVIRKGLGGSEEHRSQQWTRGVARTERHIRRQQQRSPTSSDAVLATAETFRDDLDGNAT